MLLKSSSLNHNTLVDRLKGRICCRYLPDLKQMILVVGECLLSLY